MSGVQRDVGGWLTYTLCGLRGGGHGFESAGFEGTLAPLEEVMIVVG